MGAESHASYAGAAPPPRPCAECGEILPGNVFHWHRTRWQVITDWAGYWWSRIKGDI